MRIPLQQTGYKESSYERPSQEWVCGWAAEGRPCRVGPDAHGNCTAAAQAHCAPRWDGERWHCARTESFGGPCEPGPLPDGRCCHPEPEHLICQPQRSWRARRRRLTAAFVFLTFGALMLALAAPWTPAIISPGPLSDAHLAIEGPGGAAHNCAVCHDAAERGGLGWLAAAFDPSDRLADSRKCFACHFNQSGEALHAALYTHSVDPQRLAATTPDSAAPLADAPPTAALALARWAGTPPRNVAGEMACATCHREHHGAAHDLAFMSSTGCQVCHAATFESFNSGHSQFTPVERSAKGIRFDHASHRSGDHFGEVVFDCRRCHAPDALGRTMRVKPYALSCAGCHQPATADHHTQQIKSAANVLTLLAMPELRVEDDVYWPVEGADPEEPLSPLMSVLLAGDTNAAALAALKGLYSAEDERDRGVVEFWEPDDEEKMFADLAAAMKRLLHELAAGDEAARRTRLAAALGAAADAPYVAALAEHLSSAGLSAYAIQQRWLPKLAADLAGEEVEPAEDPQDAPLESTGKTSGWQIGRDDLVIEYQPTAHADPFVRTLLDALAAHANAPPAEPEAPLPTDDRGFRSAIRTAAFRRLTEDGGTLYAACIRCHTIERAGSAFKVNWTTAGRPAAVSGFSKFDHRLHLSMQPKSGECSACHRMADRTAESDASIISRGFYFHTQAQCAACHAPGRASNQCVTCHNYHFNRP